MVSRASMDSHSGQTRPSSATTSFRWASTKPILAQCRQNLFHPLNRFHLNTNTLNAAKTHSLQIAVQATHLAARLADSHADAVGHVFAGSAQLALLTGETLFQIAQLLVQPRERLARVVDFCYLTRQATAQPIAHSQPEFQDGLGKSGIAGFAMQLHFSEQGFSAARAVKAPEQDFASFIRFLNKVDVATDIVELFRGADQQFATRPSRMARLNGSSHRLRAGSASRRSLANFSSVDL